MLKKQRVEIKKKESLTFEAVGYQQMPTKIFILASDSKQTKFLTFFPSALSSLCLSMKEKNGAIINWINNGLGFKNK